MPSEWKVSFQYIGDERVYQVYRLKDINEVDHSGNREYAGEALDDLERAQILAEIFNNTEVR